MQCLSVRACVRARVSVGAYMYVRCPLCIFVSCDDLYICEYCSVPPVVYEYLPTAAGLALIPFIVKPLDTLVEKVSLICSFIRRQMFRGDHHQSGSAVPVHDARVTWTLADLPFDETPAIQRCLVKWPPVIASSMVAVPLYLV